MSIGLFIILALIGIAAGIISGFVGIGGAILIIPALVYIAKFPDATAVGTSLTVLLPPIGIAAAFEYYRKGCVDIKAAIIIACFMLVFAWVGAKIGTRVNPMVTRFCFGLFVILLGFYVTISTGLKLFRN